MNRRPNRPLLSALLVALAIPASLALWGQTNPDTDPPQIHVLESGAELVDGRLFNRAAVPVIQATDASAVTVDALLDGAAFTSGGSVAGEGSHLLAVTATDAAGNTASVSLGFQIDTTPPAFLSVAPAKDSAVADAQVTLQGKVAGASAVTVDGQAATLAGEDFTAGPFTLAEGPRSWTIVATDAAGNSTTWTHRIVRDSQAPTVAISQPAAGAVVKDAAIDVVGSAQDPRLAGVTVNGIAATVTGSTWLAPRVPLAEGSNTLTAHAEDRAGNAAGVSRAVVRDSQPPALAVTDPASGTVVPGSTLTLRGTAADPHLDRVEVNGVRARLSGGNWLLDVTLQGGDNDFAVQAFDTVGNAATASLTVTRDSQAPAVQIDQPANAARLRVSSIAVSGTVAQKPGITVTVNGTAATVTGGSFSAPAISLVEGENTITVRAKDSLGNEGVATRKVVRDTVAPSLGAADPAAGALALPVDAVFRLTFSEPMAAPASGSWRLETGAGQAIAATASVAGEQLTVRPSALLPSSAQVRLVLTAGLTDLAGNPLASPPTLAWFTADTAAPAAPVLSPAPPAALCANTLTLAGTAEAGAIVSVQGGAAAAEGRADETGHFSIPVQLVPEGINLLRLTAADSAGNLSDEAIAQVIADCQAPRILSATKQGSAYRIAFSEPVAASTVGQAVHLSSSQGAVAGSVSVAADGRSATFTPSGTLPAGALRLDVSTGVRDLAGNALAYPWSQVFGADSGDGFLSGTVIDDATGRPLAGARVVLFATDGVERPEPKPEQVTGPDGRFRLPAPAGLHELTIARAGYTPAFRVVATSAGQGIDVFDPRLTPASPAKTVGAAGGTVGALGSGSDPVLTLPSGALSASTAVAVTGLSEQGLPAALPFGWSPRGAAWVDLDGKALLAPATLSLPVEAADGTNLALVRLDLASLQWRVLGIGQAAGGRVSIPLPAAGAGLTDGGYAALEADSGPTAPPAPVTGAALGGSPRPSGGDVTAATLGFNPQVVLPSQTSLATASYTTTQEVASGLPLTLEVAESLTLLDGSVRRQSPYQADLILYHAPDGAARSRFRLRPSQDARSLPLQLGAEDVVLRVYGESVAGNVVGPEGGSISDEQGDRVDLPAGALAEPSAVTLTRRAAQDLPLAPPAGTALAGVIDLDLGGRSLLAPAALSLALSPAPAVGEKGLLLEVVDLGSGAAWRPVAALQASATGWTTAAIDPADLPWPGVREEGLYAFVRLTGAFGYLRGTVFDVDAAALSGALVRGAGWVQIAGAGGRYVLPAPVGAVSVTAENRTTGNLGAASATIAAADARVDLDVTLAVSGPRVLQITPADGTVDVPQGVEPTVRFSEPVDPASATTGIQLLESGTRVTASLDVQGSLVRLTPRSALLPGTVYELRVGTGVRDLQGNPLDAPAVSHFTTRQVVTADGLDLAKVFLVEPDANGQAHVTGRAGAVPAGALVFVENRSALANTPSMDAAADGSFSLSLQAALTHRLVLHVLVTGRNEVVAELTPFHTADLKGAWVGAKEVTFTTGDGVTVRVPEGAFSGPTRVRVEPQPLTPPASPVPSGLAPVYAFNLDFGGAEARKALQISVPNPAGAPEAVDGLYLLNRVIVLQGKTYWMMHDLMRLDAASNRLTTELPPATQVAALADPFLYAAAPSVLAPKAIVRQYKGYVCGSAFPGQYQVMASQIDLGFTIFPSFNMNYLVGIWNSGMEGMATSLNAAIARLLEGDGILIPTREHEPYTLTVRNLSTGFKLFEQTYPPIETDDFVQLPSDVYGDKAAPFPVSGSPVRFFLLNFSGTSEQELATGIKGKLEGSGITITGEAGATQKNVQIRLIGLDDNTTASAASDASGAFNLSASGSNHKRYLMAIGARISSSQPLDVTFSEALKDDFPGVDVLYGGNVLDVKKDPVGTNATVRLHLETGWRAGEDYTLRLGRDLADASDNKWARQLDVPFQIAKSEDLGTFKLDAVRDVARLGSWLFVAADTKGLMVLDAKDPAHLKNLLPQDLAFPFPLADPVRGVAVDPHGRVLVTGGGVTGPGQLKIFDPLAVKLDTIGTNPETRYDAFKGSTIISDKLGGPGTQLPSGTPRRVAVLSTDRTSEWKLGDNPPEGVQVAPQPPNSNADGSAPEYTVTVQGNDARGKMPVTLFDLNQGTWNRIDAEESGHYSVTLSVRKGDRLRVLRNQDSIAYVATPGVGLEVADVNAFYNEDHNFVTSDLLGTYSGFKDNLKLCDQPVADISGAFLDLGTLFDNTKPDPIVLVGLVAQRGFILLKSDPTSVGNVSRLNDECAKVEGSTAVSALTVLQHYIFDLNDDGKLDDSEARDYVLVAHQKAGILTYDVTDREDIKLVGRIRMPGQISQLSADLVGRRLYVAGSGAGFYVVDLNAPPSQELVDEDRDGKDDRILETVTLPGNTNSNLFLVPELGLGLAGGLDRGLTTVALGSPEVDMIARNKDGSLRKIDRLAPFGVPTVKEGDGEDAPERPGSFFLQAHLPGIADSEVRMELVSLGAGGKEIDGLGDAEKIAGLPITRLSGTGDHEIVLKRLSDKPYEEGYNIYRSQEIAAIADVRAAKKYTRSPKEKDDCKRCDLPDGKLLEILSGDAIGARFPQELRQQLKDVYAAERMDRAETAIASVRWEIVPGLRPEPALSPSMGRGDAVPGTLLHSGEMSLQQTDLALKGRGFDLAFTRAYRSQTLGSGPLGPGWDFTYRLRLRELPNGDVEYYDGRGRRELFEQQDDKTLKAPKGVFMTLERNSTGWVLLDPRHNLYRFDGFGRLVSVADAVKDSEDTGNEMSFYYDLSSRLVRINDPLDRNTLFEYDDKGRIKRIEDPTKREVTLEYDEDGRLHKVHSPKIETGEFTAPQGLVTTYDYDTASGELAASLNRRDNITSVTDPLDQHWLDLHYADLDGDGRLDEVSSQTWGPGTVQLAYDFGSHETTVTDREGHATHYHHDEDGHVTQIVDAESATTSFGYDDEGLLTSATTPLGRVTHYDYQQTDERRSRGNVAQISVTPGSEGANGSADTLTTAIDYETYSNQPTEIVDPRGNTTRITRDDVGQAKQIIEGAGSPDASTTTITYNSYGQPERVVNGNGHATRYQYFDSGERKGYLQSITTDDGGLALKTSFEVDERGNPTEITDPKRRVHKRTWNEVDWLVASDEPLGLHFTNKYDANGQLVEQHVPVHDGSQATAIRKSYGVLGEIRSVEREIEPGGDVVSEFYDYDNNLNLTEYTAPAGQVTRWEYDNRNLPIHVTRGFGSAEAVTITAGYDAEGRLHQYTDGRNANWITNYDGYGRVRETLDPLGNKTQITYDDGGNPAEQKAFDASQQLLSQQQAEFDALNRLKVQRVKLWSGTTGSSAKDLETRITYDRVGNVTQQKDPLGRITQMTYDGAERLKSTTDPAGNYTELTLDAAGNALVTRTTERNQLGSTRILQQTATYDDLDRPTLVTDAMSNTQKMVYDARGNVQTAFDAESNATSYTYDGLDRLVKTEQPEGITITYGYDLSSRLISYKDALNQETKWAYDDLDRKKSVTYPDNKQETYTYDKNGNLEGWTDPLGNKVVQTFDAANRLKTRTVTAASGVIGPLSEAYTFDGLGRLTRATSGGVVTDRSYDSLSRVVSETSGGKTLTYKLDDAGNPLQITYPSGYIVNQTFDPLDLVQTVNGPGGTGSKPLVSYKWQGMGLPVKKDLGDVISGTAEFDLSGRMKNQSFKGAGGANILQEKLGWNPRNLNVAQARGDQYGEGWLFDYDKAGRAVLSGRSTKTVQVPENAPVSSGAITSLPNNVSFKYDGAQNLYQRDVVTDGTTRTESLPNDASHRNRPSSVAGISLEWDANGNLTRKGALRFKYDYRNRLTQVTDASGATVATYTYDVLNRRISKTVGGTERTVVWDGWRPVEEYKDGQLSSRRTYGADLDEMVQMENDLDGDGTLEQTFAPLFDHTGNMVIATGRNGKPVERYAYSPYGISRAQTDDVAVAVNKVTSVGNEIQIATSEKVQEDTLAEHKIKISAVSPLNIAVVPGKALRSQEATETELEIEVTLPELDGPDSRRRIVITPVGAPPAAGTPMKLTIQPEALQDSFLNKPDQPFELSFNWPASDTVLFESAQAIARHSLTKDNTSNPAPQVGDYVEPTTPLDSPVSAIDNPFSFHGLPRDPETGFVYMRNRYYDPELGRFITADPLGYVDGPSAYSFATNDPVNGSDPLGLANMNSAPAATPHLDFRRMSRDAATARRMGGNTIEGLGLEGQGAIEALDQMPYSIVEGSQYLVNKIAAADRLTLYCTSYPGDCYRWALESFDFEISWRAIRGGFASEWERFVNSDWRPMMKSFGGDLTNAALMTAGGASEFRGMMPPPEESLGALESASPRFRVPNKRHFAASVRMSSTAKNITTVIERGVDIAKDIEAINKGLARRIQGNFEINGRLYGVHDGALYPISGPGFHSLDRGAFKALGVYNELGNTAEATAMLDRMKIGESARAAGLRVWEIIQ
jgi:RHS repeat-associated protein